jgi:branched-chain amino acid aminotransferase
VPSPAGSAASRWAGEKFLSNKLQTELLPLFSNYAPTILIGKLASEHGCQQVLWLSGKDQKLTEVGSMNVFIYWRNEQGGELTTKVKAIN